MRIQTFVQNCILILTFTFLSIDASAQQWNHNEVLTKSLQFYEAQICGPKPDWSRIPWRDDCHTTDGDYLGIDLTGGWHDAGDHAKFHLPMAQAITMLAWTYLKYENEIINSGNQEHFLNNLRHIGDYISKCHPPSGNNIFYAQVADGDLDHSFWEAPELNDYFREVFSIDVNNPGTDLACGMAAAFASLSMVFDNDPAYSESLRNHAIDLFDLGVNSFQGYSFSFNHGTFYSSQAPYDDDIVWGALWLYQATNDASYLTLAENNFGNISGATGWFPSFRDHAFGSFILLAELTGDQTYYNVTEDWLNNEIFNSGYTNGGLYRRSTVLPAHGAAAMSFCAYYYAELRGPGHPSYNTYIDFATNQFDYILGDNPLGLSYLVDFSDNFVRVTHHRAAHDSPNGDIFNPTFDTHFLTGALVGGPDQFDNFSNDRADWPQTESAVSGQSFFVGLAAQMLRMNGGGTPPSETDDIIAVNAPTTVEQGTTETISVTYSSNGVREIISTLQLASDPYTSYSSTVTPVSVSSGTLNINVDIPADIPLGNGIYQFQISLAEPGATWEERFDNEAITDVSVIEQAPIVNNIITAISGPEVVSQGSNISIQIDYEANESKDLIVSLEQNVDPFQSYASDIFTVNAGVGSLTVMLDVPQNIPEGTDAYQYQVVLTPVGGSWPDRDDNLSQDNVDVIMGQPLTDAINNISGPTAVTPGESVNVSVEYEASESRDLVVVFEQNSDPYTSYSIGRQTVSGNGSITLSIDIPVNVPDGIDQYQFQSFISTVGGFWNDRLDNLPFEDVDVISTPPNCNDGIQNGYETGIDCGGPDCVACSACGVAASMAAEIEMGDLYLKNGCYGVILTSPGGSCFRMTINDVGTVSVEGVTCPN